MNILTVLGAALVSMGWVSGAALVAAGALAGKAPRGWALGELARGRARRLVLVVGLTLLVGATVLFAVVEVVSYPR